MLAHETVKMGSRLWLEEYRQHTLKSPRSVLIETPDGYQEVIVTGQDLDLVRAVEPEEDSMAPENAAEKQNNALALNNQLRGEEVIDPRKRNRHLLQAFGISDAEKWILPEVTQMNPQVALVVGEAIKAKLAEEGMPQEAAEEMALETVQEVMETAGLSQPNASQNGAAMAAGEEPA
jgi:hypothetical protein